MTNMHEDRLIVNRLTSYKTYLAPRLFCPSNVYESCEVQLYGVSFDFCKPFFFFFNKNVLDLKKKVGIMVRSVGRDIACYMQGPGFEPRTPFFSAFNCVSSSH